MAGENATSAPKRDDEIKALLDAYSKMLDVWKLSNDNYFKRGQLAMGVIQVALFLAALKMLRPLPTAWSQAAFPIGMAVLGILCGWMWLCLLEKQSQYLEFCRRALRNIEKRLSELNVPLEYFTLESLVFWGPREKVSPCSASVESVDVASKKQAQVTFRWSREQYPTSDNKDATLHSISRVSGGMVSFEKRLASGAVAVWLLIAAATAVAVVG